MGRMDKTKEGDQVAYRRFSPLGAGSVNARFWDPEKQMPCQQPPWAELMAVNANTGDIAWRVPLGTSDEMEAKGIHNTGAFGQGGPIATAGGLVFIAGTDDKRFRAFDSRTGKVLWETKLDAEGHTNPMTYRGEQRQAVRRDRQLRRELVRVRVKCGPTKCILTLELENPKNMTRRGSLSLPSSTRSLAGAWPPLIAARALPPPRRAPGCGANPQGD